MEIENFAKCFIVVWIKKRGPFLKNLFSEFEKLLVSENQIAQEFDVNNVTNVTFVLQTGSD